MKKVRHYFRSFLLIALMSLLLLACVRVTADNYAQIQNGMSMAQVINILGDPTSTESVTFGGLSGTTAIWKHNDNQITIFFLNDKVQAKAFNQPINNNTNSPNSPG